MKKDILLLHGALGDHKQLNSLYSTLAPHYTVHSFDFDAHGASENVSGFGIAQFADNIEGYLQREQVHRPLVFGYSMGGYAALQLALRKPDVFEALITLGTMFDWNPESAQKEVKMLNPEKILAKVPQFAKALERRHTGVGWQENMRLTANMMLELGNGDAFSMKDLSNIQFPVFVCLGENDHMVSRKESEVAAEALPNGKFHSVKAWPHPIEKIDPKALSQLITELFE